MDQDDIDSALVKAARKAADARIMCCIPFHFSIFRLKYLFDVLMGLTSASVGEITIVISTNTKRPHELSTLDYLVDGFRSSRKRILIDSHSDLKHPHDLAWRHKKDITDKFVDSSNEYFIYLEDDIRLTSANIAYMIAYFDTLKGRGLLPGFLRYEYCPVWNGSFSTDQTSHVPIGQVPTFEVGDVVFAPPAVPHQGLYVLDQALAREHLGSKSFDPIESRAVRDWGVRERAAMGMAFEAPPPGYASRNVVPVYPASRRPPACCWVHHVPNNYAERTEHQRRKDGVANIEMRDIFT